MSKLKTIPAKKERKELMKHMRRVLKKGSKVYIDGKWRKV